MNNFTQVFSGDVSIDKTGWKRFEFDTSFNYASGQNLEVCFIMCLDQWVHGGGSRVYRTNDLRTIWEWNDDYPSSGCPETWESRGLAAAREICADHPPGKLGIRRGAGFALSGDQANPMGMAIHPSTDAFYIISKTTSKRFWPRLIR